MPDIPKGAKKPADRLPKAEDPPSTDRVVEIGGHEYAIPLEAFNDFELLDELNQIQQEQGMYLFPSVMRRMLGEDQMKVAMDHLRNPETGRVSIPDGLGFVTELMGEFHPN